MQGIVILRALSVVIFAATLAGCHPSTRSAAGQTPPPSATSAAQANSTAPPDQAMTSGPGDKYFAKADAKLHGVSFSIWANGRPAGVVQWPNKGIDITGAMKGHANNIAVQWNRTQKDGTGTLTIGTAKNVAFTVKVTPSSPIKGQITKVVMAPRAPVGRKY
jgi:hypothetical protein